jgi:hypothetical protein
MKKIITLLTLVLAFSSFSQTNEAPGVLLEKLEHAYKPSTYITADGTSKVGEIKFDEIYTNLIWLKGEGESKGKKILASEIKSFNYNNEQEYISLKSNFYTKVNTENKIQLYTRFSAKKGPLGATIVGGKVTGEYKYWIIIKDVLELKSLNDISLSPFHKKVSVLLKDCPELSKKIKEKEKGYKKSIITPKHIIWQKLASEFETCK